LSDLFNNEHISGAAEGPLADKIRPKSLEEVIGQNHLLGEEGPLQNMITSGVLSSIILWGPPGVGKTTIARLLAENSGSHFEQLSAIFTGVGDLKKVFQAAKIRRMNGNKTIIFVDEIHSFNKSQQDSFLPFLEDGTIILIGATTENPSFELNPAILSRVQILVLERLSNTDLTKLLARVELTLGSQINVDADAKTELLKIADGDGRALLNLIENIISWKISNPLTVKDLSVRLSKRLKKYDKKGEEHYNLISALHKSIRGSDPDAALYWLARILDGGEDPRFIARRLLRMALEDVGLADPQAQTICLHAWQSFERLGSPEGELALAQAALYLALAPKSNASYKGFNLSLDLVKQTSSEPPPKHILNAPTDLMKKQGYGVGYEYDHDNADGFSGQNYFPEKIERLSAYQPVERGFERELKKRISYFKNLREKRKSI
jgi:putative ATPase